MLNAPNSEASSNRSALAALKKLPDPMRSIWNSMDGRDRRFLCRLAAADADSATDEHGTVQIHQYQNSWDELSAGSQAMLRAAMRRLTGWAKRLEGYGASCN